MTYFTFSLVSVLAPNYKQHILSSAKLRKICYSLPKLYVRSVYLSLFRWREVKFMKLLKGGSSHKSLGTSGVDCLTLSKEHRSKSTIAEENIWTIEGGSNRNGSKLNNEEPHNLYCSLNITVMKSRRMRWARHCTNFLSESASQGRLCTIMFVTCKYMCEWMHLYDNAVLIFFLSFFLPGNRDC
jgi:hypothetical protein